MPPPETGAPGLRRTEATMTFKVILEPSEDGGYTALVPSLPGCISEGDTVDEAMQNIKEAIELYLEPLEGPVPAGALVKELAL